MKHTNNILRVSSSGGQKQVIVPKSSPIEKGDFVRLVPLEVVEKHLARMETILNNLENSNKLQVATS